ncbi:hypothetical protein [Xenorhabdus entomophaga]|uniref:hypothetical protein n=1 Tax=Xenorhabdus entomophaga TaxID=3136257 RepID=UPI0030F47E93
MSDNKGLIAKITDTLTGASSAVSGVFGTVRDIQNMKIDYEVKSKTFDLLDKLGAVQQQQILLQELLMTAKNRIVELEQEADTREKWESEKSNYELFHPIKSTVVYRFKVPADSNQEAHYLCTNCYSSGMKSILQLKTSSLAFSTFICHRCNSDYQFDKIYAFDRK